MVTFLCNTLFTMTTIGRCKNLTLQGCSLHETDFCSPKWFPCRFRLRRSEFRKATAAFPIFSQPFLQYFDVGHSTHHLTLSWLRGRRSSLLLSLNIVPLMQCRCQRRLKQKHRKESPCRDSLNEQPASRNDQLFEIEIVTV